MPELKPTKVLLAKAAQDEWILDQCLEKAEAPLEIFGFHAQQAVEKLLKAILVAAGAGYPTIHGLADLLDLIKAQGIMLPIEFEELRYLTPFAVEFRYEALPEEPEAPLDKTKTRQLIKKLRSWTEQFLTDRSK